MSDQPLKHINEMIPFTSQCERWRARAEKMRALAENMRDEEVRNVILGLAAQYDQMAARGDQGLN